MNVITEYPNLKAPFNQNSVKLEKNSRTIEDVPTKVSVRSEYSTGQICKVICNVQYLLKNYSQSDSRSSRGEAFQKMIQSLISEQANA